MGLNTWQKQIKQILEDERATLHRDSPRANIYKTPSGQILSIPKAVSTPSDWKKTLGQIKRKLRKEEQEEVTKTKNDLGFIGISAREKVIISREKEYTIDAKSLADAININQPEGSKVYLRDLEGNLIEGGGFILVVESIEEKTEDLWIQREAS